MGTTSRENHYNVEEFDKESVTYKHRTSALSVEKLFVRDNRRENNINNDNEYSKSHYNDCVVINNIKCYPMVKSSI